MTLRIRIILLFLVAGLIPLGLFGAWAFAEVRDATEAENEARLSAVQLAAELRVDERIAELRAQVDRLCEQETMVDRVVLDLAADRFDARRQGELTDSLPRLARSLSLDVLEIIEPGRGNASGRVLASAHFPGRAGGSAGDLGRDALSAGSRPFVHGVRTRREGDTVATRALSTACLAARDGAQVLVVGGRFLDERFAGDLLGDVSPVALVIAGPAPRPVPGAVPGATKREVHVFVNAAAEPVARLVAVVDPRPLERQLAELKSGFLYYGVLPAGLVTLALGLMLGVWVTRPLTLLEAATHEVAHGNLDVTFTGVPRGEVGKVLWAFEGMTRELKDAQRELRRVARVAAWRDIARHLAHEIKNPLSPIRTSVETMRKTHTRGHPDFDEIFDESTRTVLEEVRRLEHIVREFSAFARLPPPHPEPVEIRDVVDHVVGLASSEAGVAVTAEIADDLGPIRADREQLVQLLLNLVQNGVDASRAAHPGGGGAVRVTVGPREDGEDGLLLRVVDDGPGIPEPMRERIFEPYVTTKPGGTGLGLAIAFRIAADHGGRLTAHPGPGDEGTELRLVLPRVAPAAPVSSTETVVPLVQRR